MVDVAVGCCSDHAHYHQFATKVTVRPAGEGGGALPIMDYKGGIRPKRVPFLGWRYIKG